MIDYSDLDKIDSVSSLHYDDLSEISQIIDIAHITTFESK